MSPAKERKVAVAALILVSFITLLAACSDFLPRPEALLGVSKLTYHYDAQRTGWNDREVVLTPQAVSNPHFGLLWQSLPFDYFNGTPPRLFATPLYVDRVVFLHGPLGGRTAQVLFVVTTTGFAYALNAAESDGTPPGTVIWRKRLASKPCDEGTLGNLSTPVIDLERHRLYLTSCDDDAEWQAHAVDIRTGDELPGWPVRIDAAAVNAPGINKNGATRYPKDLIGIQRGALNISPDGSRLYVTFAGDGLGGIGWIIAIDTTRARVATAFSATAVSDEPQGGMWASGGPSVDTLGRVYIATGSNFASTMQGKGVSGVFPNSAGNWGQSILQLKDSVAEGFELKGTYSPFNYCQAAANDIDLGSSGTVVIDLALHTTSTPELLALGGAKQGNVYLLDRAHMPGEVTTRQPCSTDSESDLSLLAPESQPQFGKRGPVNVFGPYTEEHAILDQARSRTTLAYFRSANGENFVFVTGSSKSGAAFSDSVPPGLAKLKIVTSPKEAAYLHIDRMEQTQTFKNPGSPVITSNRGKNAIVWVLDANAQRTAPLYGSSAPQPILYAFDASSLKLLWKSAPGVLHPSGKYNEPTVVNGIAIVGTDRIQAFGSRPGKSILPAAWQTQLKPLFNGKTLKHWRGDPAVWSVKDGAITGESRKPLARNTFLIHDGIYRNFELRFKYRFLTTEGNSGLQYRSSLGPERGLSVAGYQANVAPILAKERYAMLYEENGRAELALLGEKTDVAERGGKVVRNVLSLVNQPERVLENVRPYPEWNDYIVVAYDNHLVHAVNDVLAVDVTDNDFEGRASEGFFALQLHSGPPMGVQFKDIEIKELTAEPDIANRFDSRPASILEYSGAGAADTQLGKKVYEQRCSACHDHPQEQMPSRELLSNHEQQYIVDALVKGLMQPMATGLSAKEIDAVAAYLVAQN